MNWIRQMKHQRQFQKSPRYQRYMHWRSTLMHSNGLKFVSWDRFPKCLYDDSRFHRWQLSPPVLGESRTPAVTHLWYKCVVVLDLTVYIISRIQRNRCSQGLVMALLSTLFRSSLNRFVPIDCPNSRMSTSCNGLCMRMCELILQRNSISRVLFMAHV